MKIIKFTINGCVNCRRLSTILKIAKLKPDEEIEITSDNITLAKQYGVQGFPTLLKLDNNGKEIERIVDLQPLSILKAFFEIQ